MERVSEQLTVRGGGPNYCQKGGKKRGDEPRGMEGPYFDNVVESLGVKAKVEMSRSGSLSCSVVRLSTKYVRATW